MKPQLSTRQAEIAEHVARGLPNKLIAAKTGLSLHTVRQHIKEAASRLEGDGWPRQRLMLWFLEVSDD